MSDPDEVLQMYVRTLTGKTIALLLRRGDTVAQVKEQIEEKEGIPPEQQRLIFAGNEMQDDRNWLEYTSPKEFTWHLILRLPRSSFAAVPRSGHPRVSTTQGIITRLRKEIASNAEVKALPKELTRAELDRAEYPVRVVGGPIAKDAKEVELLQRCEFVVPDVLVDGKRSIYAGGLFTVEFALPANYPFTPPYVRLLTPVLHPHVLPGGMVFCDLLSDGWSPAFFCLTTKHHGTSILSRIIALFLHYEPRVDVKAVAEFLKPVESSWERHARQSVELYAVEDRSWTPQRNRVFPAVIRNAIDWMVAEGSPLHHFPAPVFRLIAGMYADGELPDFGRDDLGRIDARALVDGFNPDSEAGKAWRNASMAVWGSSQRQQRVVPTAAS